MSLFNKADIILAPSIEERDLIKGLGITGKIFAITPYVFDTIALPVSDFSERKDILFVGGFTHSPNVDAVLWFTREIWPIIQQGIPSAKFIIVGSNSPAVINALAS